MTTNRSGEPRLAAIASWAVLAASFGLSAATWIAMARLAGFAATLSLPAGVTADLAWLMPVAVDGYVVVALMLWMAPVPAKVAQFAKVNTYAAAGIGIAAQSAYHAFTVWTAQQQAWQAILAAIVGALPPAVAGLAVHMRALIRRESQPAIEPTPAPVEQTPAPAVVDPTPPVDEQSAAPLDPTPVVVEPAPAGQVPVLVDQQPPAVVEQVPVKPVSRPVAKSPVPVPLALFDPPPTTPIVRRRNGVPLTGQVTR